ncbi:MAG: hypothetical protein ACLP36_13625, partial [Acidimicrobiales bacterium]
MGKMTARAGACERQKCSSNHAISSFLARPAWVRRLARVGCLLVAILTASAFGIVVGVSAVAASAKLGITSYPTPTPDATPTFITPGADGNLWFGEGACALCTTQASAIGNINPVTGVITEYPLPTPDANADSIVEGPDGNIWFTENYASQIGMITTSGSITEYPTPSRDSFPDSITAGPDGDMWFAEEAGRIGEITPAGVIREYPAGGSPSGIVTGPDGNLWVTDSSGSTVDKFSPSGTLLDSYPTPTPDSSPGDMAIGPDGDVWFTEIDAVAEITPAGTITEYPTPTPDSHPGQLVAGPDGAIWFTEPYVNQVAMLNPSTGTITEYPVNGSNASSPLGITAGPDNSIWFTEAITSTINEISLSRPDTATSSSSSSGRPAGLIQAGDSKLNCISDEPTAAALAQDLADTGIEYNCI